MMFRAASVAVLLLGAVTMGADVVAPEETAADPSSSRETSAKERARLALAERLKVAPDDISVTRIEPRTWSDSSMGCGKPGTMALTVITEGYAVMLRTQGREHEVHVSDSGAVVCDRGLPIRRESRRSANASGLDLMMERARQDLAQRLGVDAADIRLAGVQPQRWSDSALGCRRSGEFVQAGPIDGFKLMLKHAGRTYTYHTDRQDVRPCPAIETR